MRLNASLHCYNGCPRFVVTHFFVLVFLTPIIFLTSFRLKDCEELYSIPHSAGGRGAPAVYLRRIVCSRLHLFRSFIRMHLAII